ncbi:hypothetical protein ACFODO_05535 [Acinetobacter sichuanensis]|uniref:Uncharacterized protein n=1 Tax=Acinetobacter sichuanensis TaxID=2136183 RepID=A0A371YSE5_9GAMM|nr:MULTISPECIES: hypothetical protein [Acinetobacter]MDM1246343.1 hypothetical protein [Acinetobacter sp. R933-2]MDM1762943.1 hypothetical protein [Acinetobacter sp. 226-1]MDM1766422.1 hypothetical protein [Acinetobacter sp. 226-4]MDQ9020654.1 hypothetical protein [Acinetobacter sichuanensis]RFC84391.1 hypothetical protein C9E89_006895 [Acinetobacter sichuanensis]
MTQTHSTVPKSKKKLFMLLSLGIIIPVLLIVIAFVAIKNDAENQKEYDRIRQEQAARIELKKQQQEQQTIHESHSE